MVRLCPHIPRPHRYYPGHPLVTKNDSKTNTYAWRSDSASSKEDYFHNISKTYGTESRHFTDTWKIPTILKAMEWIWNSLWLLKNNSSFPTRWGLSLRAFLCDLWTPPKSSSPFSLNIFPRRAVNNFLFQSAWWDTAGLACFSNIYKIVIVVYKKYIIQNSSQVFIFY